MEKIAAAEKAARKRREPARLRATQRMQTGCSSPIDVYNSEFNLEMVLDGYGYVHEGNRWLSPNSSSGSPGVSLTADGRKWLSSHDSDSGIGTPTASGTMGDAFDLFIHYEHHGDRGAAIRAASDQFGLKQGSRPHFIRSDGPIPWSDAPPPSDYPENMQEVDQGPGGVAAEPGDRPEAPKIIVPSAADLAISIAEWETARLTPKCIVENFLYADVALLSAPGGTGKTTLALYEAIHIILGRRLYGLTVKNPGWCLFITAEDPRGILVARLREVAKGMGLSNEEIAQVRNGVLFWDVSGEYMSLTNI